MRIGYACLAIGVPDTGIKSCIMKNASEAKLLDLISHNLNSLENIIDYNIGNNIRLFRISSDLIPFGSSAVSKIPWWDLFRSEFSRIGEKIEENGIRVSMHPGQYTVINSPNEEVVSRAIDDLHYHSKVLECLGVGKEHKIILHIGGVYHDKKSAVSRFITNYYKLPASIRDRIALENDDKSYNICDVMEVSGIIGTPVVYDNLHNEINPCDRRRNDVFWVNQCRKTWKKDDGVQKIHYSQQDPAKRPGSHSDSILFDKFIAFYSSLARDDIDIMLEVKDKNLSAVNCISSLSPEDTK
jgi:UV DNA damage endonuclease